MHKHQGYGENIIDGYTEKESEKKERRTRTQILIRGTVKGRIITTFFLIERDKEGEDHYSDFEK